jgi:Calcineurin-like phosphoesterase
MIAQLLNREFLLSAAEDTRLNLKRKLAERERRAGDGGPLDEIDSNEIAEVVDELERLGERPEALQPAPRGEEPAEERGPAPKDDFVYVPRDPLLSIIQTVIEETAQSQRPEAIESDPPPDERRSGGGQSVVSDHQFAGLDLPRAGDGRRAWGRFEVARPVILSDPRWAWSGVVIAWHKFKQKAAFPGLPRDEEAVRIANDGRVLLVGDWGSGIPRAQAVAARMREELEKGRSEGREQHVVHLGDVYYTGSKKECEQNFLAYWPVETEQGIGSYSLAGNHDMYQGGHDYYGTLLRDSRFKRQGGRSVFALRSEHWQFLALDSSYEDAGLFGEQDAWVQAQLDGNAGLRTAILSHHQLFSAYEPGAAKLRERMEPVLATKRVDAWFWAHEHRCLTYKPHMDVPFSSCVGHGGIPEYLVAGESDPYPEPLAYDYRLKHGDSWEPWNTFGFAVVELNDGAMTVRYIDEEGRTHHEESVVQ